MKFIWLAVIALTVSTGCRKTVHPPQVKQLKTDSLRVEDRSIYYSYLLTSSPVLVVSEAGLGDSAKVWLQNNIIPAISEKAGVLIYDRPGYGQSSAGSFPRTLDRISEDLNALLDQPKFSGKKMLLVCHSYGGFIIRNLTIHHPDKAKALLFIDTQHEQYRQVVRTQKQEDLIYNLFSTIYGPLSGAAREARALQEATLLMDTSPNLPDRPVVVLTSMKTTPQSDADDRQNAFTAQGKLRAGITNFTQIAVPDAGHYIYLEKPALVLAELEKLVNQLN